MYTQAVGEMRKGKKKKGDKKGIYKEPETLGAVLSVFWNFGFKNF